MTKAHDDASGATRGQQVRAEFMAAARRIQADRMHLAISDLLVLQVTSDAIITKANAHLRGLLTNARSAAIAVIVLRDDDNTIDDLLVDALLAALKPTIG